MFQSAELSKHFVKFLTQNIFKRLEIEYVLEKLEFFYRFTISALITSKFYARCSSIDNNCKQLKVKK